MTIEQIREHLLSLSDEKYKSFHSKLIPDIDPDTIIGIRLPIIRDFAKRLVQEKANLDLFFNDVPHKYYEENMLHTLLIGQMTNTARVIELLEDFLPYIDNWAVCDSLRPKCFKKDIDSILPKIYAWMENSHPFTIRFAVEMLMVYCLDQKFDTNHIDKVSKIESEHYYVNMMVAWYFATALAKQWDIAVKYIEDKKLPIWTHNKAIQKGVESYRLTDTKKSYIKTLKIKANARCD